MGHTLSKAVFLGHVATMMQGVLSNPAHATMAMSQYDITNQMKSLIDGYMDTLNQMGIQVEINL